MEINQTETGASIMTNAAWIPIPGPAEVAQQVLSAVDRASAQVCEQFATEGGTDGDSRPAPLRLDF